MPKKSLDLHTIFIVVDCNKLLSLELVPLLVSIFPWHVSHGSGIIDILGSLKQINFSFIVGSTEDLQGSFIELASLLQLCPL